MADTERENTFGFIDKRRTQSSTTTDLSSAGIYASTNSLRTQLSTLNAAYYTTARLNQMTKNDMVYALRTLADAAGI